MERRRVVGMDGRRDGGSWEVHACTRRGARDLGPLSPLPSPPSPLPTNETHLCAHGGGDEGEKQRPRTLAPGPRPPLPRGRPLQQRVRGQHEQGEQGEQREVGGAGVERLDGLQ